MKDEWNLSDEIFHVKINNGITAIDTQEVKEFIRRLKDRFCECDDVLNKYKCAYCKKIDKLAGESLVEEKK